jgi:hypothetical protein
MRRIAGVMLIAGIVLAAALSACASQDETGKQPTRANEPQLRGLHSSKPRRLYSSSSPFNTLLATGVRPAPNSQQIVDHWLDERTGTFGFVVGVAETSNDWDHPIYFSRSFDPVYTVQCTAPFGRCEIEGQRIRIPARARPAGGGDGHLAVIDRRTGWEYDFWRVHQKRNGILRASWGGRTRIDGNGRGAEATASGFGLAAGVIRPAELAAGRIDHALFMVVRCTNGTAVWPARRDNAGRECSDLGLPNDNAPAMGQHFYLDMSDAEIDALPSDQWQKTVLRAMAHYGLYVGDTGGGFLKIESGSSLTSFGRPDPWVQYARSVGIPPALSTDTGQPEYLFDLSNVVDWRRRLKVVP